MNLDNAENHQINRPDKSNNPNGQHDRHDDEAAGVTPTKEVGDEGGGPGELQTDRRSQTVGSEATSTVAAAHVETEEVQRPRNRAS